MSDLIGKTLGKYRIVERLGRGGMAEVYKARQVNLDRFVALKLMHAHLADEPGFIPRFEREAKNIAALHHGNIVQVYDFDVDADSHMPYIVMEFVEGVTLKTHLETHGQSGAGLPLSETLRLIRQVGAALAYAHARNMIHRDVKPANVMIEGLSPEGLRAVLTDFGLAKVLSQPGYTASGAMMGTLAYMAPELFQGQPGDNRADIYALGVMLYEILAGCPPYQAETQQALILMHLTASPPSLRSAIPGMPDALDQVILRCLAKVPEERFQSVGELLGALPEVPVEPTPPPSPEAVTHPLRTAAQAADKPPSSTYWPGTTAPAESKATVEMPRPPEPTLPPTTLEFVGRELELARYSAQLEKKHLAVICGMPGVGKTTLAAALAARASEPTKVFWHTFHAGEGVNVLLWKLAAFLAWHGQKDLWRMVQASQQAGNPPPAEVLFDYLFQIFRGAGYLLCFDDFHFVADDPLLEQFFVRLQPALRAGEVSLIIASRQAVELANDEDTQPLAGLSLSDTGRLLTQRGLTLTPEQAAALYDRTEGNAQFLTLSAENLRKTVNPARLISRLSESDSVERFLMKEVDQGLTDEEREVMNGVAVLLGYPGTRDAISAMLDGRSVRRTLNDLQGHHLVTVAEGEAGKQYDQHAIVREFYYDQQDKHARQAMHRRAGEYYTTEEPDALKAARHFQCAGEPARAVKCATDEVWAIINRGEARALRQLVEQFVERDLEKVQWALVSLARGQLAQFFGELEAGRKSYQAAHTLFAAMPDSKNSRTLRARACLGLGELLQVERPPEAMEWLRRGMEELQGTNPLDEAALHIRLGSTLDFVGRRDEAEAELLRGLALLPTEPGRLRLDALMNLGNSYCMQGRPDEGLDRYRQALELARVLDDRWREADILTNVGLELDLAGRFEEALQHYQQALELAEQLGSLRQRMWILGNLGRTQVKLGDLAVAESRFTQSITLARSKDWHGDLVYLLLDLIDVYVMQARASEAEPLLKEAVRLAEAAGIREPVTFLYGNWALARLALGDAPAALGYAERAVPLAHDMQMENAEGFGLRVLGQAQLALGHDVAARASFEQSLALLKDHDPLEAARTKVEYGLCLRAAEHGESKRGAALLREARETFVRLGAKRDLERVNALIR